MMRDFQGSSGMPLFSMVLRGQKYNQLKDDYVPGIDLVIQDHDSDLEQPTKNLWLLAKHFVAVATNL
jgi:hypothetical protein